jgi:tRNA (guanine-N7-)-methyltransferase
MMDRKPLNEYPQVEIRIPEQSQERLDFVGLFGRSAPLHIEVGSGKGAFLVAQAQAQPEIDFVGIEWASKYFRYTVDRIGRRGLSNARIVRADAASLLRDRVGDGVVDGVHVYFPDPWPKRRHHRRRFVCPENVEQILRILREGGRLQVVTDHAEYYEHIEEVLRGFSTRMRVVRFQPTAGAGTGEWVGSNFERKYLKEERAFFKIAVEKER